MKPEYKAITEKTICELKEIVGESNIIVEKNDMDKYAHDEVPNLLYYPDVVVFTQTTEQVSQIMKLADKELIPVTPRGTGTGLSGGALPIHRGILLSLEKMNKIKEIDFDNFMAIVEPGVITGNLGRELEKYDFFYPPDPASLDSCSIGGNVAENAGGPRALKYGTTKNYVTGLEAVLPNGNIIKCGGKVVKNATGYPIMESLIGSEGTLAIITEITLKILPLPKAKINLLVPFNDIYNASKTITEIVKDKNVIPATVEFMDNRCIKACEKFLKRELPFSSASAHLLIQLDGKNEEDVQRDMEVVGELALANNALEVFVAKDKLTETKMWEARRSITDALKSISPIVEHEDVVVPKSKIPELLQEIKHLEEIFSINCGCFGHAGDGNVHIHIMKEKLDDSTWENLLPKFLVALFKIVIKLGGMISGEHGIGFTKKNYLHLNINKEQIDLMKRIKLAYDPNLILNPNKIIDF